MNEIERWIKNGRNRGKSWEALRYAGKESEQGLMGFLKSAFEDMYWPELTAEEWYQIVDKQRAEEESQERLIDAKGATVIHGSNEQNLIQLSIDEDSVWQSYRKLLLKDKGFSNDTIKVIEDANTKILRQLSRDTRESGAIKGLVIGNVQSGKTANMAALMAMAADAGWNMFVVLSGMMENLRVQTLGRLVQDLNSRNSSITWEAIDNPKAVDQFGKRLADKNFREGSKTRYLAVCLKNAIRLKDLIGWLNRDKNNRGNIRMLIIDDEADQASINTSTKERTKINQLILNLVNNRDAKGKNAVSSFQAVNYIGYTATPYANVLNEVPGKESLYPTNFIATLSVSDEYFGPQQIFGYESDDEDSISFPGLNIVRPIHNDEIAAVESIQKGNEIKIPDSLAEAIYWFISGVAYMRYSKYKKPVSMLVHTSRLTSAHIQMEDAIRRFFSSKSKENIIAECKRIWERETKAFSKEDFMNQYPTYSNISAINDYPDFNELAPYVKELVAAGLTRLEINSDNNQRTYKTGIHLCVDNSDNSGEYSRLLYPESREMPCDAPAFLVIGGNTLSRGLTLEGLVSTYFLRPARCADTLMQMGRWFGYRKGYELIPRIWLSLKVRDQFRFMAEMDQKLRDEIRFMGEIGQSPSECGPKIITSPSTQFLAIVSKGKMQSAVGATYDFAGHTMETGVFTNNTRMLTENLNLLSEFITSLGTPANDVDGNPYAENNKVWKNIPLDKIKEFLNKYKYSERLKGFNDLKVLIKWLDQVTYKGLLDRWSVILAGKQHDNMNHERQVTESISVNTINRTRRYEDKGDEIINIGVLRSFKDFLSDISVQRDDALTLAAMRGVKSNLTDLNTLREELKLSQTPQILIYIIDKDSKPDRSTRYALDANEDIVGFSINIPGIKKGNSTIQSLTINIRPKLVDDVD